jgi:phthalate 4,5-dioxygenase
LLNPADNTLLTQVGPGTPMGALMREYWIPALLPSELPLPDSNPVRVKLLGEQLIAFRDSHGAVGLIQDHCPHRGASLFFGRNEESGIRCVYHGWKFDVSGACVDMPNEPAESDFKQKVRAVAYPTFEHGGIVWAYMGSRVTPPPLPNLEVLAHGGGQTRVTCIQRPCNWVQALEGDLDTGHLTFLHQGHERVEAQQPGTFSYYMLRERAAHYNVVDTPGGTMYGAWRPADNDQEYWRIGHFFMPFYALVPQSVLGLRVGARAWVPIDDEHTLAFSMSVVRDVPSARKVVPPVMRENSSGWYGRFQTVANADNDYLIDRARQRSKASYTGIPGSFLEDGAVTGSMGPVYDRSQERLGNSDVMIIRTRRRLLDAARALAQRGTTPPGVDEPDAYAQRSGGVLLAEGANWIEDTVELRRAFVEHPELDSTIGGPMVG